MEAAKVERKKQRSTPSRMLNMAKSEGILFSARGYKNNINF